jgi:hypothetical protein
MVPDSCRQARQGEVVAQQLQLRAQIPNCKNSQQHSSRWKR